MKILAFNCGSSTLKFQFTELGSENIVLGLERRLAHGTVNRIGTQGRIRFTIPNKEDYSQPVAMADHSEAARQDSPELSGLFVVEHISSPWSITSLKISPPSRTCR